MTRQKVGALAEFSAGGNMTILQLSVPMPLAV
jgi:hypothetical protein